MGSTGLNPMSETRSVVSLILGRKFEENKASPCLHGFTVKSVSQVFLYDDRFGEPPSPITDAAWESLFPEQGGFFKHPTLAPERSAFSVFHQLHCLVSFFFFCRDIEDGAKGKF